MACPAEADKPLPALVSHDYWGACTDSWISAEKLLVARLLPLSIV